MTPKTVLLYAQKITPWSLSATVILLLWGVMNGLFFSPPDYQQGDAVRIMYVHVPAAWMALGIYASMGLMALIALIFKYPLATLGVRAVAPTGVAFTVICLISGSIWGAPIWGTWWVWDARLTSVLILLFFYLGYLVLSQAFDSQERSNYTANILVVVGLINLPVVKFSVDWWNTLHQPASILRLEGVAIHPEMLVPLFVMVGAFLAYALTLTAVRLQHEILSQKIRAARYRQSASSLAKAAEPQ